MNKVLPHCHTCVKSHEVASVYLVWSHACPPSLANEVGVLINLVFTCGAHGFELALSFCIKKNATGNMEEELFALFVAVVPFICF